MLIFKEKNHLGDPLKFQWAPTSPNATIGPQGFTKGSQNNSMALYPLLGIPKQHLFPLISNQHLIFVSNTLLDVVFLNIVDRLWDPFKSQSVPKWDTNSTKRRQNIWYFWRSCETLKKIETPSGLDSRFVCVYSHFVYVFLFLVLCLHFPSKTAQ